MFIFIYLLIVEINFNTFTIFFFEMSLLNILNDTRMFVDLSWMQRDMKILKKS